MSKVQINTKKFKQSLERQLQSLTDFVKKQHAEIKADPPDFNKIKRDLVAVLPQYKNLTPEFLIENDHEIGNALSAARTMDWSPLRLIMRIHDYTEMAQGYFEEEPPDHMKDFDKHVEEQLALLPKVVTQIEQAVNRVEDFSSSPITIIPNAHEELSENPVTSFYVDFGEHTGFSTFTDLSGNIKEIDDVLEGGDEDSFSSLVQQMDYFSLIKEIRKPGSSQIGKTLTLYTARPVKDRNQYMHTKVLPVNLFLSNKEDHVEGLAQDYGGRDVWMVKVNERYLVQTLEGYVKYYQIVKEAPLKEPPVLVTKYGL